MLINIKPLSVNEAWQGKRFKTKKYDCYIRDVLMLLPRITIPDGNLTVEIEFGMSNKASDIDNPVKCFIDCLQKKYKFDDKMIYKLIVDKSIVKKGGEYISFAIYKNK